MPKLTLNDEVNEMKNMAVALMPYTFPAVALAVEKDTLILKQRTLTVDGYDILTVFSRSQYTDYVLETLQLQSVSCPFLPFGMVCKLGRAFLGDFNLSYVEFFKGSKKIYCWTLRSVDGRSLVPDPADKGEFEGFKFSLLQPGIVDLH